MEEHLTNRQTEKVRALEACNQKTAAFGLTLTEGDIGGLSQTPEGWACLTELLAPPGRDRRRHLLEQAGERLARRLELGLAGAACLTTFARDLVPRVEAVLDSGTGWQGIFPILG